ncbi:MAG: competence/damage-inducible protein A [Bacteroidales bacterium]|nr:competence/damage-inducible protein A [Bacteroidales bacterium]
MNNAEIITIGDEILIGQTIDTNSAWMGTELNLIGVRVNRITSISDRSEEIKCALSEALTRADIVLVTGGLGPTSDDITKETLAEYFGAEMVMNKEVLAEVTERLHRRNLQMNENNRRQALVPDKCTVLMNRTGTAPGMMFVQNEKIIVSMPGVPYEMKHIMSEHVLPLLSGKVAGRVIMHKNIMTYGTFEAKLAEMLETFESELPENIRLAYLPAHGVIKLRLTAAGGNDDRIREAISMQVEKLYGIIPALIYGEDEVMLEEVIGKLLNERNLTLSTAESCTGGRIASLITTVPGSSGWYRGSVVAYDNTVKTGLLGVQPETLRLYGAVSAETAGEMARGIRKVMETDYSIAVTGIAGPSGGTPDKPVGTVWIAIDSERGLVTEKHTFADDRLVNISRSSYTALNLLRKQIIST